MTAIDERDQLDRARTAEVDQRVERRANRAARVEHVVHEQDQAVVDGEWNFRAPNHRLRPDGVPHQVVAVERDVERSGRHVDAGEVPERLGQARRQRHASRADADERQALDAAVVFDNFVGDADEASRDAVRVHHNGHIPSLRPLRTALKKRTEEYHRVSDRRRHGESRRDGG